MTGQTKCIAMDPPWEEYGGGNRGAQNHYGLMKLADIAKAINRSEFPDGSPAFDPAPAAHLWVWVTDNYLLDGLSLIDQLGFVYKRTFAWVKVAKQIAIDGSEVEITDAAYQETIVIDNFQNLAAGMLQIGLGQYARGSHELLLFASRGRSMVPKPENRPPSVFFAPRGKHSEKPDISYEVIERVSPGPRVEMFSRRAREGWLAWGDEAREESNAD